jgi:signal transduction histidine kinase
VLDYARPIQFNLSETDVAAVCRTAVDAARSAVEDVAIESRVPATPLLLVTDGERVRAVLVNVLSNAQQAVRSGPVHPDAAAPVSIDAERVDDRIVIRVGDTGAGIGPEDLRRVFEPFFTTKPGGSGVGLAIARNIIEGLGGAIRIESQQGAGTTVYIELTDRSERRR